MCLSKPPCCTSVFLDLLPVHDNFGNEDGILRDFYYRKSERHSLKQDPHDKMGDEAQNPVRNIGKVQKFVVGTDFEAYAEQLEFFFMAKGVTDSKQKKAVLLTNLPTTTYQLAKDLVVPVLLREDTLMYNTMAKRLQKQLKPQKSALVARYEFDNRAQTAGEMVSQYVAVLKHLATDCKSSHTIGKAQR